MRLVLAEQTNHVGVGHGLSQAGALVRSVYGITFVTALAALYPSLRAARLRPVVAMSHFG